MEHQFRQRLRSGELLVGTMVTLGYPEVAEILTTVGFDWLFLDAEHGPFEAPMMQRFLPGAGMPCLVRLSASEQVPIKKALDVGAAGIIAPMVNSAEQAERVVRLSKYAPLGTRGVGLGRAHGYGLRFQEYVQSANEDVAVVIQAEHIEAVENIEAIVQVPGIDAVLIGPYDLSASLGRLGEVNHPEVVSAVDCVTQACQGAGVPLGVFGMSAQAVKPYIERGYTLIVAGVDSMLLGQAARRLLAQVKAG
ncbi:MAG: 2,4-dihydroxyhept-2-ene-1,7-dioic acid aldolase [Chloroflexi bacterium]|nr:2,4-dihydroxyhept-2-ene-1,7-dioic acid aldolase [Chloroflexota bacterium]